MDLKLTLPCYYAYELLKGYLDNDFTEFQLDRKFGLENEIEDFDEFVEFFTTVSEYAWNSVRDNQEYCTFDYVLSKTKEKMVTKLVKASINLLTDTEDSWQQQDLADAKASYEKRLNCRKRAKIRYNNDELLKYYVKNEFLDDHWVRSYCDDLDYEYKKFVDGSKTLEEASRCSYADNWYRKKFGIIKD